MAAPLRSSTASFRAKSDTPSAVEWRAMTRLKPESHCPDLFGAPLVSGIQVKPIGFVRTERAMDLALTVIQGLMTLLMLLAGAMKLIQPRAKIISSGAAWEGFSAPVIKLIGVGEVLCAIGILVPQLLGHGFYATSVSAVGICVFMLGAFVAHFKQKQPKPMVVNTVFFVMAGAVAYFRWPWRF
jgi:DoxX-like family